MNDHHSAHEKDTKPEIYCALSISLNSDMNTAILLTRLRALGIERIKLLRPKNTPGVLIDIAIVQYEPFWEIDHALTKMFSMIDHCIPQIKELCSLYNGHILIDIAIVENVGYPALLFSGTNMNKIHDLCADISIDLL